jgi:microcin C transport system substrate-binding protein
MLKKFFAACLCLVAAQAVFAQAAPPVKTIKSTYITLRGEPLYKQGFTHFNYVNLDAPKGGSFTRHATGTYDNFHRYALRGSCVYGYQYFYDTLMTGSQDEADALYPLVASEVEYAADYSFIILSINPNARDNEGEPITAEDAAFSFNIIFEKGVPPFRSF